MTSLEHQREKPERAQKDEVIFYPHQLTNTLSRLKAKLLLTFIGLCFLSIIYVFVTNEETFVARNELKIKMPTVFKDTSAVDKAPLDYIMPLWEFTKTYDFQEQLAKNLLAINLPLRGLGVTTPKNKLVKTKNHNLENEWQVFQARLRDVIKFEPDLENSNIVIEVEARTQQIARATALLASHTLSKTIEKKIYDKTEKLKEYLQEQIVLKQNSLEVQLSMGRISESKETKTNIESLNHKLQEIYSYEAKAKVEMVFKPNITISAKRSALAIRAAMATMLSLGITLFILFLASTLLYKIQSPQDFAGVYPLGAIPVLQNSNPLFTTELGSNDNACESLQSIMRRLTHRMSRGTLLITGPAMSCGKSSFASNLALMLSQNGKKVLLVDLDLRLPQVKNIFHISENSASADFVLSAEKPSLPFFSPNPNLDILPAKKVADPLQALESRNLRQFLKDCFHYDYIIIDSPPILETADAAILAAYSDAAIVVLGYNLHTPKELHETVTALKTGADINLFGVMNFYPYHRSEWPTNVIDFTQIKSQKNADKNFKNSPSTKVIKSVRS